jgi:hypothetical protein
MSVDMTSTSNDTLLTLRDKINAVSGMTAHLLSHIFPRVFSLSILAS